MWKVEVTQSCPTLRPHGLYSPWTFPGQNTGMGSLSLLQGIFPTQGLNPGLPHCGWILYQLNHKGSPRILQWVACSFSRGSSWPRNRTRVSCISGRFFTNWTVKEARGMWIWFSHHFHWISIFICAHICFMGRYLHRWLTCYPAVTHGYLAMCTNSEWTPGVGDGQGGLACCNSLGHKESDTTERLNWTDQKKMHNVLTVFTRCLRSHLMSGSTCDLGAQWCFPLKSNYKNLSEEL